ncbi:MAG: ORF6N domain-containing protein [Lachnospira sp.]|nr:ORF6N domain-containing protein [Lachnospira sp.]
MGENTEVAIVSEKNIHNKIYNIRGQKVMLDFELAEIYGYTTTRFNEQVKNNIEKFDEDFMFELTKEEFENLISKKSTSSWGGRRKLPRAFTEQGIYMLMTVLRGELAIKQSKALVRTFKNMKDYIINNRELIGQREYMQLSMQNAENTRDISKLKSDMGSVEKQMCDIMDKLSDVVKKSDLADVMNNFVNDEDNGWLIYNTKYCTADLAYSEVYAQAKKTIYVVDNYIGLRTLVLLKNAPIGVNITLFSDNIGGKLHSIEYRDFSNEYPSIKMTLKKTGGVYHDRFIVLDYGTEYERIFLCGASSKDAGARVTSIVEDFGIKKYKPLIDSLLKNPNLVLA